MKISSVSLNKKFSIAIFVCFFGTAVLFLAVFSNFLTAQVKNETQQTRKRTEQILELSIENLELKDVLDKVLEKRIKNALKEDYKPQNPQQNKKQLKEIKDEEKRNYLEKEIDKIIKDDFLYDKITQKKGLENPTVPLIDYTDVEIRYEGMLRGVRLIAIGGVIVVIIVLILWFLMQKYVVLPVERLVKASRSLAKGDLTTRVDIPQDVSKTDELDILALSFNEMADSLQNSLDGIVRKERFQQALIDAIPDGIRVIDQNFNVIMANKSYAKYVGLKIEEIPFTKCYETSHRRDTPCPPSLVTCPIEVLKRDKKPIKAVQRFIDANDKENYVEISAATMETGFSSGKKDVLVVEAIRDLTEDIRFSHQQKLSSVGMLATSVAHEMRNPLGSIRMILEGLVKRIKKGQENKEETIKYMNLIIDQIADCINVTQRLLKMSKNSADDKKQIDVKTSIVETLALLDYEAKRKGVLVDTKLADEDIYVFATESEIRMALVNLIQNAFHAMPENNGKVEVLLSAQEDNALIEIKDNGVGMSAEKASRIFEPFFTKRKENDKGTGLGLTITKSIIDKFGGDIKVSSKKGEGTSFKIYLPLVK